MSQHPQAIAPEELPAEDRARANMYALLGRLFYTGPDADLIACIRADHAPSDEDGAAGTLSQTWQTLRDACKTVDAGAARQEHDTLFVGVGKSEVTPYTSHYVSDSAPDRHLVALRDQLTRWGLGRTHGTFEVEDHIAGVCDVMRFLIEQQTPLEDQRQFFERFVYRGALPLFEAVRNAASANFYKPVVALADAFLAVEKAAFEMHGSTGGSA